MPLGARFSSVCVAGTTGRSSGNTELNTQSRYAPVGKSLGNSWRIGPDDTNWAGILKNIDINADLAQYAGPGGWYGCCLPG